MNAADKLLLQYGCTLEGRRLRRIKKRGPRKKKPRPAATAAQRKQDAEILRGSKWLIKDRESSDLSKPEIIIAEFLSENGVEFIREHHGPRLFNPMTKKLLFVDFYLPEYNLVIEFDGPHHYLPVKGMAALKDQRLKDQTKNTFCQKAGIHMLRIRKVNDIETAICRKIDKIAG